MGQKVNPIGLRVAVDKDWRSRWFSGKKQFGNLLNEDLEIRALVMKRLENAAVARVNIERYANRVRISIHTARPGIVIGRKGQDIERIRTQLAKMTGKEIYIEIKEIRDPDCNAQLVAENIAMQMERRVSFRTWASTASRFARPAVWAVPSLLVRSGTKRARFRCIPCVPTLIMVSPRLRRQPD